MSNSWEQDILAREEENRVAFLAADIATLDRLWTDDFAVNSPINVVNDKARTLALLQSGRIRHTSLTSEIELMRRHGNVVVVMGSDRVTDRAGRHHHEPPVHQPVAARGRDRGGASRGTRTRCCGRRGPERRHASSDGGRLLVGRPRSLPIRSKNLAAPRRG